MLSRTLLSLQSCHVIFDMKEQNIINDVNWIDAEFVITFKVNQWISRMIWVVLQDIEHVFILHYWKIAFEELYFRFRE